jgi:hypothetical protein
MHMIEERFSIPVTQRQKPPTDPLAGWGFLFSLTLRPARMHVSNQQVSQVFQGHCISDGCFDLKKSAECSDVNFCPTSVSLLLIRETCLRPSTGIHHQVRSSILFHP